MMAQGSDVGEEDGDVASLDSVRWNAFVPFGLVDNLADVQELFFRSKGACLSAAAASAGTSEEAGLPQPPSDEVYRGKRRHPQPQLARARHEAAAEAAQRREQYDQAWALHAPECRSSVRTSLIACCLRRCSSMLTLAIHQLNVQAA